MPHQSADDLNARNVPCWYCGKVGQWFETAGEAYCKCQLCPKCGAHPEQHYVDCPKLAKLLSHNGDK